MKRKLHWTQTPEGRKRCRERMIKFHNRRAVPVDGVRDDLSSMTELLKLFDGLSLHGKDYIRKRIS